MTDKKDGFKYSIENRFGKTIASEKWGILPYSLYLHQDELGLKIRHVWFLAWIWAHKWEEKAPFPSLGKLSRISGYSDTHIRDISKELQEMGLIQVSEHYRENGARDRNRYHLEPLEEALKKIIMENDEENAEGEIYMVAEMPL